jgi:hypothetical protein
LDESEPAECVPSEPLDLPSFAGSAHQHDLSAGVAALAQLVRGRGLDERKRRRDRHPRPAPAGKRDRDSEATHRFAALMIQSFRANRVPAPPLPLGVRLPLPPS